MHEFTAKYDAKSAQPMSSANEPRSFPDACMQASGKDLLYVLEVRLLSMSH